MEVPVGVVVLLLAILIAILLHVDGRITKLEKVHTKDDMLLSKRITNLTHDFNNFKDKQLIKTFVLSDEFKEYMKLRKLKEYELSGSGTEVRLYDSKGYVGSIYAYNIEKEVREFLRVADQVCCKKGKK